MSVQSRRKPSKLFTATICGFIWVFALWFAFSTVQGTLEEIRNQAVEGTAGYYNRLYLVTLLLPVPRVLWRVRCIDDLKMQYLALQLFFSYYLRGYLRPYYGLPVRVLKPSSLVIRNREFSRPTKHSTFCCFVASVYHFCRRR